MDTGNLKPLFLEIAALAQPGAQQFDEFVYVRDGYTKDGIAFRLRPASPSDAKVITANIQAVCAEQVYLYTDGFVWTDEWRQVLAHPLIR